ncbi:hypothetical protein ASL14_20925 [Paenibacillus sp. IHB B 3084]|uniref:hypothetical protein n=1 Tax=Paenibacillus sp. IHB B 3084 TaxID=867076 RepID=UPI00071EA80B|nr:hypothetical protein [Paenibacillus sp. IHB B 3084]ALP38272.1 hypothetical protein ASL14_20925 [Paenibacillus sp. IHB B 3084]
MSYVSNARISSLAKYSMVFGKQPKDKLFVEKGVNWNDLPFGKSAGYVLPSNSIAKVGLSETNYINQYVYLDKDV